MNKKTSENKCYDCARETRTVYTDLIDGAKFCEKCQNARITEQQKTLEETKAQGN